MALVPQGYTLRVSPTIRCRLMTTTENPSIETMSNSTASTFGEQTFRGVWDELTRNQDDACYTINYPQNTYIHKRLGVDDGISMTRDQMCYPIFNGGSENTSATWKKGSYSFTYPTDVTSTTIRPGQIGNGNVGTGREETLYFAVGVEFSVNLSNYGDQDMVYEEPQSERETYTTVNYISGDINTPNWLTATGTEALSWNGNVKYESADGSSMRNKLKILHNGGGYEMITPSGDGLQTGNWNFTNDEYKTMRYVKMVTCSDDNRTFANSSSSKTNYSSLGQNLRLSGYVSAGSPVTIRYRCIYIYKVLAFEGFAITGIGNRTKISVENFNLTTQSTQNFRSFNVSATVSDGGNTSEYSAAVMPFNSAYGVTRAVQNNPNPAGVSAAANERFGFSTAMLDLGNRLTRHRFLMEFRNLVSNGRSFYLGYREHNWRYQSPAQSVSSFNVQETRRFNNRDIHLYFFGESPSYDTTTDPPAYLKTLNIFKEYGEMKNYNMYLYDPSGDNLVPVLDMSYMDPTREKELVKPVIEKPSTWNAEYFKFPLMTKDNGNPDNLDPVEHSERSRMRAEIPTSMLGKIYQIDPPTVTGNILDTTTGNTVDTSNTGWYNFTDVCKVKEKRRYIRPPVGAANPSGYFDFHCNTPDSRISRFTVKLLGDGLFFKPSAAENEETLYTYAYKYNVYCHFFYFDPSKDSAEFDWDKMPTAKLRKTSGRSDFPVLYTEEGEGDASLSQETLVRSRVLYSRARNVESEDQSDPSENAVMYGILTRDDDSGMLEFEPSRMVLQTQNRLNGMGGFDPMSVKFRKTDKAFSDDAEYPFEVFLRDNPASYYEENRNRIPGLFQQDGLSYNKTFAKMMTDENTGDSVNESYEVIESN